MYVTDVDHSDIVVEGNLFRMGKTFLKHMEKDEHLLRVQSKFHPKVDDENYNLNTFNSI